MHIHTLEGYIQNIYLVEYPDKLMLLDGCCRADVDTVFDYITEQLKRPVTDLKLIVVTHMHPDHAGGAHALRKLSGGKIATSNAPGQWYRGIDGFLMHLTDIALAWWVAGRLNKNATTFGTTAISMPTIILLPMQFYPALMTGKHFTPPVIPTEISAYTIFPVREFTLLIYW